MWKQGQEKVMNRSIKVLIGVTLGMTAVALVGCTTSMSIGNDSIAKVTQASLKNELVKGKTTEAAVRKDFGDPAGIKYTDNGNVVWQYMYQSSKHKGSAKNYIPGYALFHHKYSGKMHVKQLMIYFDKAGILKNYILSNSVVSANANTGGI